MAKSLNLTPMYSSSFQPYRPGTGWASSPMPPSVSQARARFPQAEFVNCLGESELIWVDGVISDWWQEDQGSFEAFYFMYISAGAKGGVILQGVAVDKAFTETGWRHDRPVYSHNESRTVFWNTKDWVVLLAIKTPYGSLNMTDDLRRHHKSIFGKWPGSGEVEEILSERDLSEFRAR